MSYMKDKFRPLPPEERKTILLLCDDIRMHSGIATMAREIVTKSAHHFNWFNLGAALQHPEAGKIMDLSADVDNREGIEGSNIKVMPNNGYGDPMLIRKLLKDIKPDAVMIFTDPRYWTWLFDIEREIRSKIPIHYLNIWDDYPSPLWNKNFYNSVDTLMAISKQTLAMNKMVLREEAKDKILKYVPHGIDSNIFKPVDKTTEEYKKFRNELFGDKEIEYVAFFNSRNIHRKRPADVILAFRHFCDKIGKEKARKTALVMHTSKRDDHGTDLQAVKEAFCDPDYVNVFFSEQKLSPEQMNLLYNVADVQLLISSNEGWGLSLTEAIMSGTMIIPNTTGGMQDQARFEDEDGNWIDFSDDFPSNHRGTYKKCGEWAVPVFPTSISVAGSPPTPYIFDDRCQAEDVTDALLKVYELGPEERDRRGLVGREWAMGTEAKMSADQMVNTIIETLDEAHDSFTPRAAWEVHKIADRPQKYVQHKLTGY